MKKKDGLKRRFIRYMRRTWANKAFATLLIIAGILSTLISPERDATFLLFSLLFGVPLFITSENYIIW